ncbi:flagellar hook assembly protein FlgD [Roseateles sp. BYS78W]|uniref:Basal-body rod modification protein FlgD n=1 Tax=Pelomonas candidula TaxID=3299025 RepID=A0ABW7HGE3_9BURK
MSTTTSSVTSTGSASLLGGGVSTNGDLTSLFTTLLVAQIKNQDPLQPNDPSQFVSQLAQLSQVQSMQQLVTQGKAGNSTLNGLQMMALGAQVGSVVRAGVSQLQLDGQPVTLHVNLDAKSTGIEIVFTNPYGATQSFPLGDLAAGDQGFTVDPKALGLPAGSYSVQVRNADRQSLPVEAEALLSGVRLGQDGSVFAQLAGVGEVASSAITRLEGRPATTSTASN